LTINAIKLTLRSDQQLKQNAKKLLIGWLNNHKGLSLHNVLTRS